MVSLIPIDDNDNEIDDPRLIPIDDSEISDPRLIPIEEEEIRAPQPTLSTLEKIQRTGSDLLSQFQQGAETAERGVDVLLGQPVGERRIPLREPSSITEKAARITGEFIAPLPQFAGIPGIGFAINQAGKVLGSAKTSTKALNAIRQTFDKFSRTTSSAIKGRIADAIKFTSGVEEFASERLLEKGGKILKPEFFVKGAITKKNREKAISGLKSAFDSIGKQFDSEVAPILKASTEKIELMPKRQAFLDDLAKSDLIKSTKKGELVLKKGKVTSGLGDVEKKLSPAFNNILEAIDDATENPTLKTVDLLRKRLDNIKFGSSIVDNNNASLAVTNLRKSLIEEFPESYKRINSKFKSIFEIRDTFKLGGKLSRERVESTLLGLSGRGKTELNLALKFLDSRLPRSEKFFESILDELAAKQFTDFEPKIFQTRFGALATGLIVGLKGPGTLAAGAVLTSPRLQSQALRGLSQIPKGLQAAPRVIRELPRLGARQIIKGLGTTEKEQEVRF